MNTLRTVLVTLSAASAASVASADPFTYRGKLGTIDIVVEIASDRSQPNAPIFGRYFYLKQGIDIPLQARSRNGSTIVMEEEEACGEEKCGDGRKPPVAAVWTLEAQPNGDLAGTWKGKRTFPLLLKEFGGRMDPDAKTPLDLYSASEDLQYNEQPITLETTPYDYLRLDVQLERSRAQGWSDALYNYVVDPRTQFGFPRVVELAGGVSLDAANALLTSRHWRNNIGAFSCASLQYAGLNQFGPHWSVEAGSLGGFDESQSEVLALTPRLFAWRESGSLYCGGAHPHNFSNRYTMDVADGELLAMDDMFVDVTEGRVGEELIAFVRNTREKPSDQVDADFEAECGTDDLIAEYLSASVRREGEEMRLVFGLEGLPHVINACGDDLLELPVADARHLFTPRFAALLGL